MAGALRIAGLALVTAVTAGCAPEFDKVSEIETLRVLAVQKDNPYTNDGDPATPDDTVNLSILWRDAPEKAGRPVQLQWLGGCFNPLGDLIFGCGAFTDPTQIQLPPEVDCPSEAGQPCNNKFSLTIPPTILERPRPSDPTQPAYGLAYVFFALCAGNLELRQGVNERDFPFVCLDPAGNRLGSDDFVAGYTAVYKFEKLFPGLPIEQDITNGNPAVLGFFFNDSELGPGCERESGDCLRFRCVNDECLDLHCAGPNCRNLEQEWSEMPCGQIPCVKACEKDGDEACPPQKIRPKIVAAESELPGYPEEDVVSNATRSRNITEQMWINYYAESGGVKSEVRLLNDAFEGVNQTYGTEFYAPKDPGMTVVWAVVHDNRGGMSWVGVPVRVE